MICPKCKIESEFKKELDKQKEITLYPSDDNKFILVTLYNYECLNCKEKFDVYVEVE